MRALVLGGGGVAGIAWELGVLLGIRDVEPDLFPRVTDAILVVGTSAGAAVGAQITSGTDLQQLYDLQCSPETEEIEVDLDAEALARASRTPSGVLAHLSRHASGWVNWRSPPRP